MISPLPGAIPQKPGSAALPFFGVDARVVSKEGKSFKAPKSDKDAVHGYLVIQKPWPSMARTIHGDPERYARTYWGEIPGVYFSGDGARLDADGYIWMLGRVDDVINVSGHRLGTAEVESALVSHPAVAEAAVVARPSELKGQEIVAFVTLKTGLSAGSALADELRAHVAKRLGSIARPEELRFAAGLPKTRSGKIMRRLLRELATTGHVSGDTSTLEDAALIDALRAGGEEE